MKYSEEKFQMSATDLANHLGCKHLTQLNRLVATNQLKKPDWSDPALAILAKRGEEHENAYVDFLRSRGLTVTTLKNQPLEATLVAMRNGADVITQATLSEHDWTGNADILLKVNVKSIFGDWSYEVQDTKLSQNTRAATILQLSLYTDLLSKIQGTVPEKMYVVKPGVDFPTEEFLYTDFQAYYRLIKNNFEQEMTGPPLPTYPERVAQCDICRWWKHCDTKRHDDDHLSLVAGIRSMHIGELTRQQINTLEKFAKERQPLPAKPERGNIESYQSIHEQAKVQWEGRTKKQHVYRLLDAEVLRGLSRLPEPNAGDIYFDIEGDPFYDKGGLEYLLGFSFKNESGSLEYQALWALDRNAEKKAFENFIDFVMARWKRHPKMYIYHYGIYEPAAVKRLTGRHGTRGEEVDKLLRAERFINLHAVIKEGLRASVERYSLKDLELFTSYQRKIELVVAGTSRRALESALELNEISSLSKHTSKLVQDYNEDDCLATEAVHYWLEKLRTELIKTGASLQRPELKTGEANENIEEIQTRAKALYNDLVKTLPEDKTTWTDQHNAKWLLANQIDYFRRENKSAWWEYYRVHELDYEELLDERKAITGLQFTGEIKPDGKIRMPVHRYSYPDQEVGLEVGDELHAVLGELQTVGTVYAVSLENRTIDIKKTGKTIELHPRSLHVKDVITPEPLPTALFELAEKIIEDGIDFHWPYRAAKDLLLRRKPNLGIAIEGSLLKENENVVDGAIRIASSLKNSILAIQGPPGSGKTYTGAMMLLELARMGKRVGVTAISHKVIRNLFDRANELRKEKKVNVTFVHKPKEKSKDLPEGIEEVDSNPKALKALDEGKVVGGTAWLWADNDSREKLDYLFVDEAGQMSLSFVLAASRAAKNLILLGDPQQLEQPQRGAHPEGADVAALTYLLDGHKTMPDDKGLFLSETRRLHPKISSFTSELFYEGRLKSLDGLEKQRIDGNTPFKGSGLYYVPVKHSGNQNKSVEEIQMINRVVDQLTSKGIYWFNMKGEKLPLTRADIIIVAPYNAQVAALKEKLPDVPIGTVDKFQGQEGAVVIYSMTSSSVQDAPRGMNFLFNPNRFNVATSRARCVCILVASPRLFEPACSTIDQMRWTNALCRFRELAVTVSSENSL
jgi:predicted RecB family nuclease